MKLTVADHTWNTHVHVPRGWDGRPAPVVVLLHGAGGGGRLYLDRTGWARKADREGFLVAAPDGLPLNPAALPDFLNNPRLWNSGQLTTSPRARVDDLAFFRRLVAELVERGYADPARVFLAGHSNGGAMTFRLGAELGELFAALAPVAAACWVPAPMPKIPRATIAIAGTVDPFLPLGGGEIKLPWFSPRPSPPLMESYGRWAVALGCSPEPRPRPARPQVQGHDYGAGFGGVNFLAWLIEGQGHNWPGGQPLLPEMTMGPDVAHLNATDTIWEFFQTV
jgi:polyhydroxybutyrate depolymerase